MRKATTNRARAILNWLRAEADDAAPRAHAPYSGGAVGAALLLSDGQMVPGVRVESASFSLTIPALLNAMTTAVALERRDVIAGCLSRPLRSSEKVYLDECLEQIAFIDEQNAFVSAADSDLPNPTHPLAPFLEASLPSSDKEGVELARRIAERAQVPESNFHVGCILLLRNSHLVPGVNVEHPDWSNILCAERNALGTCLSYGTSKPAALYLSCPADEAGTPCGACRQLLAELTPGMKIFMDRGAEPPDEEVPASLLPGSFRGENIVHSIL